MELQYTLRRSRFSRPLLLLKRFDGPFFWLVFYYSVNLLQHARIMSSFEVLT
jgi:hypothetical protein